MVRAAVVALVICLTACGHAPVVPSPSQRPDPTPRPATVELKFTNPLPPGAEGPTFFLKGSQEDGKTVVDATVPREGGDVAVPPGSYTLTAYQRDCSSECGRLDPLEELCSVAVDLVAGTSYVLTTDMSPRRIPECLVGAPGYATLVTSVSGSLSFEGTLFYLRAEPTDGTSRERQQFDFSDTVSLPPGDYRLVVRVFPCSLICPAGGAPSTLPLCQVHGTLAPSSVHWLTVVTWAKTCQLHDSPATA